ncbi:tol-pal system-associated acyl-CoA thioesterase [Sphingomonas alpina]|uniref:Tol-pal system-associated acyl-CoA thioesterase n=1 Tax=Sphingomonas alpina TaxID=653931 RepID=A0A7H0LGH6_9SPHN|nr:tol-pal system-associated acyl-CoA thioesterase [Sphingomonas alpina]QNQ08779.1 tol-pal system-associated acyl-CoA thioesterase [Sphingomonas alpina]
MAEHDPDQPPDRPPDWPPDRPIADQPVGGRFDGSEHRFPIRVYFEDTDLSGVVYHANYLRFMERARSDMLRLVGVDQRGAHDAGEGAYAITELAIRYKAPAKLDDALVVVSRVAKVRAASVDIQQRVMRGAEILTTAEVTAALVGASGRPRRQPKQWIEAFERLVWVQSGDEGK